MYTRRQIIAHERSLTILQMIVDANTRIENCRADLYHYDNAPHEYTLIRLMNTRESLVERKERYEAVRDRLVLWYADVMKSLFEEAMFRIGETKKLVA